MTPADRAEYIVACVRKGAAMYPEDAEQFLAEHDAHTRSQVLTEVLAAIEDPARRVKAAAHFNMGSGLGWEAARDVVRLMGDEPSTGHAGKDTREGESTQPAPDPGPATVEFSDGTVTLIGWSLTELAPDYYGVSHMQLDGWPLPEGWEPGSVSHGTNHMVRADLPGASAHAHNVNVQIEVKGYGGPQRFMKIQWRHGYDPAEDKSRPPADSYQATRGEPVKAAAVDGQLDRTDWVSCSHRACRNGEYRTKAPERGWHQGPMDAWLCTTHAPGGGQ